MCKLRKASSSSVLGRDAIHAEDAALAEGFFTAALK
jgi:hypothetical protein